jgi:hypothetical protein
MNPTRITILSTTSSSSSLSHDKENQFSSGKVEKVAITGGSNTNAIDSDLRGV